MRKMSQMNLEEKLKGILKEIAPGTDLSRIRPETELAAELGLNSMDSLMLMMQIEDEFGFEFTRQGNFRTVEDVCRYIRENATRNL